MKKIAFFTILILSLFIINNLVRSIYNLWQKQDLLVKAKNEVIREKQINETLKKQLTVVSAPDYVEEEARNKLLLRRSGEKIVLIPSITPTQLPSDTQNVLKEPTWKQWLQVFF
jgi:cell division protein FtsB